MNCPPKLHAWVLVVAFAITAVASAPVAASAAWPGGVAKVAVSAQRVADHDVFGSAALAANQAYPAWAGVQHVVLASGDAGALGDAAIASSLCWAYDAPLLLVSRRSLPAETRDALAAIASANASVTVHVVGSSSTISAACVDQVRATAATATVEHQWKTSDRYTLAANVAQRVRQVAADTGRSVPNVALVANGADVRCLWDVAAGATVARHTGIPILLTSAKFVPAATTSALTAAGSPPVVILGGTSAVSSSVYGKLGASGRWGGPTRYATATSVAAHAVAAGYSDVTTFGVAASAPDAVIGSSLVGSQGGVLLYTGTARLDRAAWSFLAPRESSLASAYVIGGSIASAQLAELRGAAATPWFAGGAPGRYVGKKFRVTGWVGGNTTSVSIIVRGKRVKFANLKPWTKFNFTSVSMPVASTQVSALAENPDGPSGKTSRTVKRLKYPSATCIVIDKSDFKLYWVKNNQLVKAYPIATGQASMETPAPATWKILAKYHTSPGSVYGPRKMRMFRQRGSHFVFSAYGIHGTNQEWVIGTKASHGCIRMYNRDVLELFPHVPLGTLVYTRQ